MKNKSNNYHKARIKSQKNYKKANKKFILKKNNWEKGGQALRSVQLVSFYILERYYYFHHSCQTTFKISSVTNRLRESLRF